MFIFKLFSFLKTIKRDELAGFAFDPILVYGMVAMGFLCLLAWAFLSGQFHDIERPKHDMLKRFEEQERAEAIDSGARTMSQPMTDEKGNVLDSQAADLGFGKGVECPGILLIFYLSFLVFFVWYTLEYQLPDYLEQSETGTGTIEDLRGS